MNWFCFTTLHCSIEVLLILFRDLISQVPEKIGWVKRNLLSEVLSKLGMIEKASIFGNFWLTRKTGKLILLTFPFCASVKISTKDCDNSQPMRKTKLNQIINVYLCYSNTKNSTHKVQLFITAMIDSKVKNC